MLQFGRDMIVKVPGLISWYMGAICWTDLSNSVAVNGRIDPLVLGNLYGTGR